MSRKITKDKDGFVSSEFNNFCFNCSLYDLSEKVCNKIFGSPIYKDPLVSCPDFKQETNYSEIEIKNKVGNLSSLSNLSNSKNLSNLSILDQEDITYKNLKNVLQNREGGFMNK